MLPYLEKTGLPDVIKLKVSGRLPWVIRRVLHATTGVLIKVGQRNVKEREKLYEDRGRLGVTQPPEAGRGKEEFLPQRECDPARFQISTFQNC